jgi:hypothetical protein
MLGKLDQHGVVARHPSDLDRINYPCENKALRADTYFVAYTNSRHDFEQCLTKPCSVVCIVQLCEAQQRHLNLLLAVFFFYP